MDVPKSNYLKEIIKKKSFSKATNRVHVLDLLNIERYITDGVKCYSSGILFNQLQGKYQEEYFAIKKELDPRGYLIELKERDRFDYERKNYLLQEKLDAEKKLVCLKEMWAQVRAKN